MHSRVGLTTYSYDPAQQLDKLDNPHSERTTLSYDDAGRVSQRQLGNGTKAKLAYDPSNRLNQVVNTTSANVTLSSYDYALDGIGNFSSAVEDGTRPINWGTDSLNQITSDYYFSSLTSESWMRMILAQWDSFTLADWDALPLDWLTSVVSGSNQVAYSPAGNRTTRTEQASGDTTTYAYSPTNRLTTADDVSGRTTYTYDANGNVLSIEEPSGDLTTNTWDGENRLVQVEHTDGAITTYSYNADGLRVEEDHDGVIKRLVYDGNNVQLETDDVGDLLVDNTYVPNNYGMALSQRRDGDSSFYLADGTQDVRQLTDSVQSVTDEYEFDAWGNSLSSTGGTPNAQQYKGQQLAYRADPDAGPEVQYALHFRQYDPHTARFTSRDPAEDDLNLYRYVKNNPVNEVDPSGLGDGFETLWSDWTEWVWGKSQAANEFLDQTPSTDPADMLLKDAVKGGLGAMAHVATSHPDPTIRQTQDAAFSGGILANNSVVQTYDLLTNPGEIFDRAVGNGADQELASETIQKFAVSLDPHHAQYGQDAAGGLEALSTATGMASAVAPLKVVTEPMRPLKRLLRRFMKFGRSSPAESIDKPQVPAPKAPVTNDPVTARLRLEAKAKELQDVEAAAAKSLERVREISAPTESQSQTPKLDNGQRSLDVKAPSQTIESPNDKLTLTKKLDDVEKTPQKLTPEQSSQLDNSGLVMHQPVSPRDAYAQDAPKSVTVPKTRIEIGGGHATVEIVDGVGQVKVPFVENMNESFFRSIQAYLKQNNARTMVVEFQASNTDLAIDIGLRMQQGRTLLGGRIELVKPGKSPVFRIVFDSIP